MSLAGKYILLKQQKKTKPCERCGLHYPYEESETCIHCGDLDEAGLKRLLAQIDSQYQWRKGLGFKFIVAAVLIIIGLVAFIG